MNCHSLKQNEAQSACAESTNVQTWESINARKTMPGREYKSVLSYACPQRVPILSGLGKQKQKQNRLAIILVTWILQKLNYSVASFFFSFAVITETETPAAYCWAASVVSTVQKWRLRWSCSGHACTRFFVVALPVWRAQRRLTSSTDVWRRGGSSGPGLWACSWKIL